MEDLKKKDPFISVTYNILWKKGWFFNKSSLRISQLLSFQIAFFPFQNIVSRTKLYILIG